MPPRTRTLSSRPAFVAWESLRSYLVRFAAEVATTVSDAARTFGLMTTGAREDRNALALHVSPTQRERVAAVLGTTEPQITRMTVGRFARLSEVRPGQRGRGLVSLSNSSACRECLAESGGAWLLRWRLAIVHSCVLHDTQLEGDCPDCGRAFKSGSAPHRSSGMPYMGRVPDPMRCDNVAAAGHGGPCDALLSECPRETSRRAGNSSEPIEEALQGNCPPPYASATGFLLDLAEVAAFAVRLRSVERAPGSARHSAMWTLAEHPAVSAEATDLAWDILKRPPDHRSWHLLLERSDPGAKVARSTGPDIGYWHLDAYRQAQRRRSRRAQHWVNVETALWGRTVFGVHVPSAGWPSDHEEHLAPLLGSTYVGRRLGAALLQCRVHDMSLADAAAALGWPATTALTSSWRAEQRPALRDAVRAILRSRENRRLVHHDTAREALADTPADEMLADFSPAERVWLVARATGAVVTVSTRRALTRPYGQHAPIADWRRFVEGLTAETRDRLWTGAAPSFGLHGRRSSTAPPEDDPHLWTIGAAR